MLGYVSKHRNTMVVKGLEHTPSFYVFLDRDNI